MASIGNRITRAVIRLADAAAARLRLRAGLRHRHARLEQRAVLRGLAGVGPSLLGTRAADEDEEEQRPHSLLSEGTSRPTSAPPIADATETGS